MIAFLAHPVQRWALILSVSAVVLAVGVKARDWYGVRRPCSFCKAECRVQPTDPVPLHPGCRAQYADSKIENVTATFEVTREQIMPTKLAVTDAGATITGTLGVYDQTVGFLVSAPTKAIQFDAAGVAFCIEDITTSGWDGPDPQPSPPPGTIMTFAVFINVGPLYAGPYESVTQGHEFVYVTDESNDDIERTFSLSATGKRLWREETTSYGTGRDGKPVYADDVAYGDSWTDLDPIHIEASFGSLTWSADVAAGGLYITAIASFRIHFDQHFGTAWTHYAAATGLSWSAVGVNFSGMSKTYGSAPPGTGMQVIGDGSSLNLTANFSGNQTSTWLHGLPRIPSFGGVHVFDRDGEDVNEVRLTGPWRASLEVPDSLNWSTDP